VCFSWSGVPTWDVPKGRKDGRISMASETKQLPAPTFNISQLQQSFSKRGISLKDLCMKICMRMRGVTLLDPLIVHLLEPV